MSMIVTVSDEAEGKVEAPWGPEPVLPCGAGRSEMFQWLNTPGDMA